MPTEIKSKRMEKDTPKTGQFSKDFSLDLLDFL